MAVDSAGIRYEAVEGWERLPAGWSFNDVAGVATDSEDRVYVFNRGEHPVIVFDPEGTVLEAWGEGAFVRPHGMFITPDDRLFLVDDDSHTVYEYTLDGEMKSRIGDGTPSDTGFEPGVSPVARAAGPFNTVTNVAVAPSGEIFACDGYGNARVHKFDADGNHLLSWGSREAAKVSSTCRTESPSTARSGSTSPTGKTPASRSSQLRAPFSTSGTGSTGPPTSTSTRRTPSTSARWDSTPCRRFRI